MLCAGPDSRRAALLVLAACSTKHEPDPERERKLMEELRAPVVVRLSGIYQAPNGEIFVTGERGAIFHRPAGATAFELQQPTWADLGAIAGAAADNVWVAGDQLHILHYDGHAWRMIPTHGDVRIHALAMTGPDDVWAIGGEALVMRGGVKGFANTKFSRLLGDRIYSVWARPAGDLALVGGRQNNFGDHIGFGKIWFGDRLVDDSADGELGAVGGIGDDIWTTGSYFGTPKDRPYESKPFVLHVAGGKIFKVPTPELHDGCVVWARAKDDVWIGGTGGYLQFDGKTWLHETIPNLDKARVCGFAGTPDDLWIVARGEAGKLIHKTKAGYAIETLPEVPRKFTTDFPDHPKKPP